MTDKSTEVIPLSSKPRFEILDGLRGVAAMIVVAFHLFETYSVGPKYQIVNHGYLAVDFFFVLSGFVIGYAYDDRWTRMSIWNFFTRRLIRLQPMVILGTLIGAFWFYFSGAPGFELVMQTPWWKLLIIVILGCIMFRPLRWISEDGRKSILSMAHSGRCYGSISQISSMHCLSADSAHWCWEYSYSCRHFSPSTLL